MRIPDPAHVPSADSVHGPSGELVQPDQLLCLSYLAFQGQDPALSSLQLGQEVELV